MDEAKNLPLGWVDTKLETVAKWGSGGTPSRRNPSFYNNGNIPWIKTGELKSKYIRTTSESITEEAIKKSSAKLFPKGSVAIAMYGATIGRLSILGIDATTNQACAVAQPYDFLYNEYLYYFLNSEKRNLINAGKGGAQPNISQTLIKDWGFKLPPLNEQKRIVAEIEKLFSELDKGEENLKHAQEQLKVYRQSILKHAFEGKLTAKWREENGISCSSWENTVLGNIAKWGSGGTPSRKNASFYTGSIPWIKTGELNSKYVNKSEEHITEEAIRKSSAKLFPKESVAIAMYGATIGKCSIFGIDASTNQACAVAQVNDDLFNEYLYYYLISQRRDFENAGKGGAQPNISQTVIKDWPFKKPSLEEQKKIVIEIEEKLSVIDQFEKDISDNLKRCDILRQAILKKAFSGQLVEQDPNDEPASVLLERISQEKQQAKPAKRTKKKVGKA